MDIRKFFSPVSTSRNKLSLTKKGQDEKKETKSQEMKKHVRKKRGARIMMESDSDDEEPLPKCARSKVNGNAEKNKKNEDFSDSENDIKEENKKSPKPESPKKVKPVSTKKNSPVKTLKMVSVDDFFGDVPVRRASRRIFAEKTPTMTQNDNLEAEIHQDENFKKTLEEINAEEKKVPVHKVSSSEGTMKEKSAIGKEVKTPTKMAQKTNAKSPSLRVQKPTSPEKKREKNFPVVVKAVHKEVEKKKAEEVLPEKDTLNETSITPEDKRRANSLGYRRYLQRDGPEAPGSKEIPEGKEGCLQGLTFVVTGVLDSLERDEAKELIEKYQGKVTTSISKKTSYIVIGKDCGVSKLEKAEKFGTKKLNEDELLEMIRTSSECSGKKTISVKKKELPSPAKKLEERRSPRKQNGFSESSKSSNFVQKEEDRKRATSTDQIDAKKTKHTPIITETDVPEAMWVDKHKPSCVKNLIGQQGEKSNAKKLTHWLKNWHLNIGKKHPPPRFGALDDGASRKAALLSGSPGVGKTTTAQLVCKELGFSYIEMNASDTRSKKNLQEHVQELLTNQTLNGFLTGEGKAVSLKHAIIMDEVDGMSGNEDRGGTQELIALIKSSRIPIICICNDRAHPKIRSLANYCFDLRFQRPRVEQIKAAMMSIAYKENLKITPAVLQEIIVASNQDVRQVLHNMSLWCTKDKGLTAEQAKSDTMKATKDIKLSPFDVLRKVFSAGQEKDAMTIHDKSDLFFHDYSLAPLFVQENYLDVKPIAARGNVKEHLKLLSTTADSICDGDLVDSLIRKSQIWSLLPIQGIYSSVIPGDTMRGYLSHMIQFPSWLGKNSSRNHMDRVLQALHMHTRLRTSSNKSDLNMEYMSNLKDSITKPLLEREQEGVSDVLKVLEQYFLLREDIESIMELSTWSGQQNPMTKVNPKVKAALTRAFNKEGMKIPYSTTQPVTKKRGRQESDELGEGEEGDNVEEENIDEDDISSDAMIKKKKGPATARGGRGRGRTKKR